MVSRREDALAVAESALGHYETGAIDAVGLARLAFRIARLLDDVDAETWLRCEVAGYPRGALPPEAWAAAVRSGRSWVDTNGAARADTQSLGQLLTGIATATMQMQAAADRSMSISSANPYQVINPPPSNVLERSSVQQQAISRQGLADRVAGVIFEYVVAKYHELRFGTAVETAFEVVRAEVDSRIAQLLPDAPRRLTAAFENATSENPEHWAGAAAICRRLLVTAADALRPPGPDVGGRKMGPEQYVNRLIDWIARQETSRTLQDVVGSELEQLGRRLDAVADAGNKGAHSEVSRYDASRFLTGTYLLLGDILRLAAVPKMPNAPSGEAIESDPAVGEAVARDTSGAGAPLSQADS